ncbi:Granzyme G [Aix galericulata]|nr:Granzyme G [Aix galericulata]
MAGAGRAKAPARPYMAYLEGKNGHFCGGFLVAPSWVMTAAQCFRTPCSRQSSKPNPCLQAIPWYHQDKVNDTVLILTSHKPLTVILGAHNIQRREESWQMFEVQRYHRHPDFTNPMKGNDILLLKLKGNATSNSYVRTISFQKIKASGGTVCSIAGWGHKAPTATFHEANVTIHKQRDCLTVYPGLANNLICANSGSAGVPEEGDTGGPLVCNNKAYGIFSYQYKNRIGFYTHIAPYLPWVDSIMKSA